MTGSNDHNNAPASKAPDDSRHQNTPPSDVLIRRLYADFERPLKGYFAKRIHNASEVDDLVQDVFHRLTRHDDLQTLERPEAYIFQIAANLLRDRARRDTTRKAFTQQLSHHSENSVEEISPERVLQGKRRVMALENALKELPERTRAIFLLHRFEEYKYREIAQHFGISASSVEKHMMAAMKHIVTRMGRE